MINVYRNNVDGKLWAIQDGTLTFQWSEVGNAWLCMLPSMRASIRKHCKLVASNVKFK